MTRLLLQDCGSRIAVGITGDTETEITDRFNSFFNHQATDGDFHWITEGVCGYFWTDQFRFMRALVVAALYEIINKDTTKYKKQKGGALPEAWRIAEERRAAVVPYGFLSQRPLYSPYQLTEPEAVEQED